MPAKSGLVSRPRPPISFICEASAIPSIMALVQEGQEYEAADFEGDESALRREFDEDEDLLNEIILSYQDGAKLLNSNRVSLRFAPVTKQNIHELRSLNSTLFPMAYQDRYYREVLASDSLARIGTLGETHPSYSLSHLLSVVE